MKWLTELFGGKIVEDVGAAIDGLSTSNEEKSEAKNKIAKTVLDSLNRLGDAQRDVLVTELKGNAIQRMWRPLTMLAFVFIVIFHFFIYPLIKVFNPELPQLPVLEAYFWELLKIGLGGYVVGRSVEKVAETMTKNTDLSFLKRKDRKSALRKQAEVDESED
tara:strand:+ start:197 stop:682 length:486 start_codon:yes stop_codon:yes gene_type:complete